MLAVGDTLHSRGVEPDGDTDICGLTKVKVSEAKLKCELKINRTCPACLRAHRLSYTLLT